MAEPARVVVIEGDRVRVPASALDHAGFRSWVASDEFPAGVRAAYVGGEIFIQMSPESIETHSKAKLAITTGLTRLIEDEDLGEAYPDGTLLTNVEARLSAEPDFTFASWASLEGGRVLFTAKRNRADDAIELVGSPDIVVEVVSDSSTRKDYRVLRDAYARAAIPEYWIVDARSDVVAFEILTLRDGEYAATTPAGEPQTSVVLGRSFTLTRTKNRVGHWSYRLVPT